MHSPLDHTLSQKSYRNSLAPVSRLPHILLTDIFILIHQSERTDNIYIHRSPPCLQISHVCKAWRDSALQCPLLWTDILFRPPEWTPILLERARTAPLTVGIHLQDYNLADDGFVSSVRLALSHIHHIRYLCIALSDRFHDLGDLLSPFLTGSPDILKGLMLFGHSTITFPNYIYPSMENAPCLRHLVLHSCDINWQRISSVGNLTSLDLQYIPDASKPSVEDILSLLHTMNKLEKLSLIHAISELPDSIRTLPPNDIPSIRLHHMLDLSLAGFVLDCANLIRHFVMPRCRHLTVNAKTHWRTGEIAFAVPPLANIISSSFSQLERQELPYLASISRRYGNATRIAARPLVDDAEELSLHVILTWGASDSEISPGFGSLLSNMPLGRVVHLSACREFDSEDVDWLEVLPRLSRVESVVLSGDYAYEFVNAFHDAQTRGVPSLLVTDAIIMPHLKSLKITNAHFSYPLGNAGLFSTLKRTLTRRLEREWTVPSISLVDCHITPQQLDVLNTLALGPIDCTGGIDAWGISSTGHSDDEGSWDTPISESSV